MTDIVEICQVENVDDVIKQLWTALAREMFEIEPLILPSETNTDQWVSSLRENLARRQAFLLIAKIDDRKIGFAYAGLWDIPLELTKRVGSLNDLYVLPAFRGKGIGRKLVLSAVARLKAAGAESIMVRVLKGNKVAIKLYEKLGFTTYNYGMIKQIT